MPSDGYTTTTPTVSISPGMLLALVLIYLVVLVFYIAVMWKVFTKAGRPGWAAIIPIYNAYILCKIAGRSSWWVLLLVIPIVNIVIGVILSLDIAKAFGKGGAFGFFGLFLFALIGYPILAFGARGRGVVLVVGTRAQGRGVTGGRGAGCRRRGAGCPRRASRGRRCPSRPCSARPRG